MRERPDRAAIEMAWIQRVIEHRVKETVQRGGRIRRWAPISQAGGKAPRAVLLADGQTGHNAFFDRGFAP